MASKQQQDKQEQPVVDQYHGQGGTYVVDPETGERTLVERTEEPKPAEE